MSRAMEKQKLPNSLLQRFIDEKCSLSQGSITFNMIFNIVLKIKLTYGKIMFKTHIVVLILPDI